MDGVTRWTAWVAAGVWVAAAACGSPGHAGRFAAAPAATPADVDATLFLIGDAGAPAPDSEPVLAALRTATAAAINPVVVFLGDNVYPHGLPDSAHPERPEAERRLEAQLGVLAATGADGIFVPGNHDWDRQGADGWDAVRRQEAFVDSWPRARVDYLPGGGCPGPVALDLGSRVRIVVLDTQWWLHEGAKPVDPTSPCPADSESEVRDSLRAVLRAAGDRRVVVVAHHPLESGGPHGGHFDWKAHVFPLRDLKRWLWVPLPIIGSVYPVARQLGVSNQDAASGAYRRMRAALEDAFRDHPPLVYASGHDHSLQVIAGGGARHLLVSGAGTYGHRSRVAWRDSTRFAASASGFMRLEILRNGRVRLGISVVEATGRAAEAFSMWLQ
ncbi:MAG: metallophosphoesterase [Gemmatimonadales bacterium]